jgi:hypothetical protein
VTVTESAQSRRAHQGPSSRWGSPGTQPQPADALPAVSPVAGSGRAGVVAVVTVAIAYPVLWVLARPDGQPVGRFLGELCGAEAVLLFSCSLVLATLLEPIERAFGGLDRVAVWHRRARGGGRAASDPARRDRELGARSVRDIVSGTRSATSR